MLIKQARAEHHGDDQRQLHHSMGQHHLTPKEASLLHNLTQHCATSPETIAEGPWKAW
jgi:hypothetical protein